ncbi:hypothetical protein, partial [Spiroplasma endosymbiont of Megaselia nigra]|uniref:hypothetical protein n=1 Tax=Spiroplasma endosymbiont of Megaselia nigra TaxID=2478537 RepID=UPI000FBB4DB4
KLGVITANNLEDVVRQVTGKKILSDKLIFDFTKQANNETLLYTIGKLARNDFYKGFKVSNLETINNLLKIEKNIQKISDNYKLALVQDLDWNNTFDLTIQKNNLKWIFWHKDIQYFKSVYRWNLLDTQEPNLILDENNNIKVNGE